MRRLSSLGPSPSGRWLVFATVLAPLLLLMLASTASAQPSTAQITVDELVQGTEPTGLVPNDSFMPSASAGPANHPFHGTIHLSEAQMGLDPDVSFGIIFGKDPTVFPEVSLSFFSDKGRLVPRTQDVIRVGCLPGGTSYWDVIVQPGRVWSEPGDGRWSRASFPFALVHSIEGETHNGIATFLYNNKRVSHVRFQKVQQTAPYYVYPYFDSWGVTAAELVRNNVKHLGSLRHAWRQEAASPAAHGVVGRARGARRRGCSRGLRRLHPRRRGDRQRAALRGDPVPPRGFYRRGPLSVH